MTITKNKNTQVSVGNQDTYNIKPVSELNLAETYTGIGKAGKLLRDGYEELAACKNKKDFDTAMKGFTQLVSSLKNEMKEEMSATDNNTEEYNNYCSAVLSGFEEWKACCVSLCSGFRGR